MIMAKTKISITRKFHGTAYDATIQVVLDKNGNGVVSRAQYRKAWPVSHTGNQGCKCRVEITDAAGNNYGIDQFGPDDYRIFQV
jgi:hypothetical protein